MYLGNRRNQTCDFDYRTLDNTVIRKHGMTDQEYYLYNWGCPTYGEPQQWRWTKNDDPSWRPYKQQALRPIEDSWMDEFWRERGVDPILPPSPYNVATEEWEKKAMRLERSAVDALRRKHPTPAKFYDDCKDENGEYRTNSGAATFLLTIPFLTPEREDPLTALVTSEWFEEETEFDPEAPMSLELDDTGRYYIFQGWVKKQ